MTAPPPRQDPPPQPPRPRISEAVVDAPTQRSYLAALCVLVQAYKLSEAFWPTQGSLPLQLDDLALNWRLWKWIAIDLVFVAFVAFLRVPRLTWGWKARWLLRLALCGIDYALFGRWTVSPLDFTILLPRSQLTLTSHVDSSPHLSLFPRH